METTKTTLRFKHWLNFKTWADKSCLTCHYDRRGTQYADGHAEQIYYLTSAQGDTPLYAVSDYGDEIVVESIS